jgi:hypothetical protein
MNVLSDFDVDLTFLDPEITVVKRSPLFNNLLLKTAQMYLKKKKTFLFRIQHLHEMRPRLHS